jgi:hypothetical protein
MHAKPQPLTSRCRSFANGSSNALLLLLLLVDFLGPGVQQVGAAAPRVLPLLLLLLLQRDSSLLSSVVPAAAVATAAAVVANAAAACELLPLLLGVGASSKQPSSLEQQPLLLALLQQPPHAAITGTLQVSSLLQAGLKWMLLLLLPLPLLLLLRSFPARLRYVSHVNPCSSSKLSHRSWLCDTSKCCSCCSAPIPARLLLSSRLMCWLLPTAPSPGPSFKLVNAVKLNTGPMLLRPKPDRSRSDSECSSASGARALRRRAAALLVLPILP